MALFDITLPLTPGMPVWPGEPGPELTPRSRIAAGDPANVTSLCLGSHTGTHIDAPRHFIEGAAGIESLSLDALCGPARVVQIDDPVSIRVDALERARLDGVRRVLFRTRNGALWEDRKFRTDFVFVATEAAQWLVARGVRLVGIDYLSVEQFNSNEYRTHHVLLGAGVVIVEGLDLRQVEPGDYELACLPLKVVGADGAPCRAVLRR